MKRVVIFAVLIGCAVTRQQADRRVERAGERSAASLADSKRRYLRAHDLEPLEVETRVGPMPYGDSAGDPDAPGPTPIAAPADAGFKGEGLVAIEPATPGGPPRIGLTTPGTNCSCGCSQTTIWAPARAASGAIVILRLTPKEHRETIKLEGTCGMGCGTQMPPTPGAIHVLPIGEADAARIRIVDVPYGLYTIDVTCDDPMPMP